jgi:hypothetical protein
MLKIKTDPKPDAKAGPKPEVKAKVKPEAKAEPKPDVKPEAKEKTKPETKVEPKTQSKPEPEPKAEAKSDAKPEPKPEPKPEVKPEPAPELKTETKPEAKAEPQAEAKTPSDLTSQITKRAYELYEKGGRQGDSAVQDWEQAKRELQKNAVKADPKPKARAETPSNLTPQIVKRVHELYEELGREDVQAVQDWEKSEREIQKDKPKAEPPPETQK